MYSSKKDLDALKIMVPILLAMMAILYIFGFQFAWVVSLLNQFEELFQKSTSVLIIPLGLQFAVLVLIKTIFSIKRARL